MTLSRARALAIVKIRDFAGCQLSDLEQIITLTGSKLAIAERQRRIDQLGPLMKDARGNLRR